MKPKPFQFLASVLALGALTIPTAQALGTITWIGGNVVWTDGGSTANWSPLDEPDFDDDVIFNTANTVDLGSSNSILSLTMSAGMSLLTNGFDLTVDGTVTLSGAGTDLTIETSASLVNADSVTLNNGGDIILDGGALSMSEESGVGLFDINAGGTLFGQGTLTLADGLGVATTLMINDGTISAGHVGIIFGSPPVGTLAINATNSANARLDLDGAAIGAVINAFRNQTLDINVTLFDAYSGDMNLFHNSTIDVSTAWSVDAGATVDIDNGFVPNGGFFDIPASTSFISGAAFTQSGGTITVIDTDGTLQFNAPFTQSGGSLVNNGKVVFNAAATIAAGANFTMPNTTSSLTVNAGVVVNVDQLDFNADGAGVESTNIITINSGGILDLDLGAGADEAFGGTLNLNGGEFDVTTADATWNVNGAVNVGAATGTSQINGSSQTATFTSVPVVVGASSVLDVNAISTWITGATMSVGAGGSIDLTTTTLNAPGSISGAGTLRFNGTSLISGNTTVGTTTFDWDGIGTGTLHTINDGVAFTINSTVFDNDGDMDDPISLGGNAASIIFNGPATWGMKGTLTANTAAAGTATIGGTSRMVLTTATGLLNVTGNTTVSAPVTFDTASVTTISPLFALTVTGNAIYNGGTISGGGRYNPPGGDNNTVSASSTINATNFNFDGGNWVIQPGPTLTVNVTDYDPDAATNAFDSTITFNSGRINITTGDAEFVMNGTLNLNNTINFIPFWTGEPIAIGNDAGTLDAKVNVGGTGISQIASPARLNSDADVAVAAGTILQFLSNVDFNTVNGADNAEFTGAGELSFSSTVNVNEAATLNMTGGTVDLDGLDGFGDFINIDAPFVINAATLSSFGKFNGGGGTNTLDVNNNVGTGILTVNLDNPAGEWTLNAPGRLDLINGNLLRTLLFGSSVNLNGTVNVTGDVRTGARVDIGGTVAINTAAEPFTLGGGNTTSAPNTLVGGTINGPGPISANSSRALHGFGNINAQINFPTTSNVLADNGQMNVADPAISAGNFGTADTDGILNVTTNWNAVGVVTVLMRGGELKGGTMTNNATNGIVGNGLVSARINNNKVVQANNALAPLVLQTAANDNDWDGLTNVGILQAVSGATLECQDNAAFPFTGSVSATGGSFVSTVGFALTFNGTSSINLTSSTYQSTNSTNIASAVNISAGADSTIKVSTGTLTLQPTSVTTLNGNLRLDGSSRINPGATFSGAGSLIIPSGKAAVADATATIGVILDNRGTFRPAGDDLVGRVDANDYQQTATGQLLVELTGTGLAQFDRLVVSGAAQLAGTLDLDLDAGFVPALGQTFNILSVIAGVSGTFTTVVQPVGMPAGLSFVVSYASPTIVQLQVVASSPYDVWINSFGSLTNPADKTKGADPDNDGLKNIGEFGLDGNPASGASSGKIVGKIAPVGGVNALTYTIPVRNAAVLDGADPLGGELVLLQAADGLTYRVQATDDLGAFTLEVTEVIGADATAIQAGLPVLNAGWTYRTFRSPGPVAGDPLEFMRAVISG